MARRKLDEEQVRNILTEYDFGYSPSSLAEKYGVHYTTIRRYLRESGRETGRIAHHVLLSPKEKLLMRKIMSGFGIPNPDFLISELDKHFTFQIREDGDGEFELIHI